MNNRPMGPKDWGFDVAVTAAAFLFGCVQLMLAASSIVIPDLALRQYLGMVNVVPNVQVFVALAVTTLPLVVRRRFPWPVFLFCLVSFLGLQNAFNGFSLTIVGPVVALYTIASEREILALVARGFTNDEIGSELFISPATVKTHLARIMAKLDAHDRAQLVVRAYEGVLVRPGIR